MNLFERLDAVADRWNVLRHPFYERWECGGLSRDKLAYYAGEYRHAVTALAGLAASASDAGHAAEEAAHVAIWDDFAAALDADLERAPRAETVAAFDAAVRQARNSMDRLDAEYLVMWTLKRAGQEMFSLPRAAAFRTFVFSHLIHHRGQLSVYLRLLDVPLPAIYGPTADEG